MPNEAQTIDQCAQNMTANDMDNVGMILWVYIDVKSVVIVCFIIISEFCYPCQMTHQLSKTLNIIYHMTVGEPNQNKFNTTICCDHITLASGRLSLVMT